ncbi:MAG: C25 family cysteine peptidase [Candidatus Sumerlaeaceae bacterium]
MRIKTQTAHSPDSMSRLVVGLLLLVPCLSTFAAKAQDNFALSDTTATVQELSRKVGLADNYARISIRYRGAYRITGAKLQAAGVQLDQLDPLKLALWNEGKQVPILLRTDNATVFGPADSIEFLGDPARGTYSTYKPDNTYNIYFLNWATESPQRYSTMSVVPETIPTRASIFREHRHLEKDFYYRTSGLPPGTTDNFYWLLFNAGSPDTFPVKIDFPGFARELDEPVKLVFRLFGFSDAASVKPGHKFSIKYANPIQTSDSVHLGTFEFDGKRNYDFVTSLPATAVRPNYRILFDTPAGREDAVDAISLDWIEAEYPRRLDAEGRDLFYFNSDLVEPEADSVAILNVPQGTKVFAPELNVVYTQATETSGCIGVKVQDRKTSYTAVSPEGFLAVEDISVKRISNLARQVPAAAEALVLYHPDVAESARSYVQYRTSTGIQTAAVNVQDVFDHLNNGFISDAVLKRYIRYAAQTSKLKYIVMWGDSTADYRQASNFDETTQSQILIPIHWIVNPATTWTKGYVDDNWYASFYYANTPDLALGRVPVNDESQGFEYLRKVIEYEQLGKSRGDKALLLSSVEASFQDLALETQKSFADHFSSTTVLFPETKTAAQEVLRLDQEFNSGIQMLYYVGHGGAAVWRVGPTDFTKQKDLFTPKDVARLHNAGHYPIIAASSCYTTSFDYTFSLGEALILQPQAGAIAIVGAPWKSTVYEDHAFNKKFFERYLDPQIKTLGEAFVGTKRHFAPVKPEQVDSQTFTLLGDPCLKLMRRH